MKKILFLMTLLVMGVSFAFAQTNADIKFDKTARLSVAHLPLLISAMPLW